MVARRLLHFIFFAGTAFINLYAQQDCQPNPYLFYALDRNAGLMSNRVNCVAQDQAGFWWFGTDNGLQRFDGHAFERFDVLPGDSIQLERPVIALYQDRSNRLWVVTNNQILQLDTSTNHFVPAAIKDRENPIFGYPSRIIEDSRGDLWLATSATSGLLRLRADSESWESVTIPGGASILGRNIQEDPVTGHIWIMFKEPGKKTALGYMDGRTGQLYPGPDKLSAEVGEATQFTIDGENNLWTSSRAEDLTVGYVIQYLNSRGISKPHYLSTNPDAPFFSDRKGRFWHFSFDKSDFGYYDKNTGKFRRFCWPVSYNNNASLEASINDFFEDREGNIWISTLNGLFVFNPDRATIAPAFALPKKQGNLPADGTFGSPLRVAQTSGSTIWVGTYFRGTYLLDRDFQEIKKYQHPVPSGYVALDVVRNLENFNTLWVFEEDLNGNIWAGGQSGVIIQFDPSGEVLWKGQFLDRTIRGMALDQEGKIWLGTQGGILGKLDPEDRELEVVLQAPQSDLYPTPRLLQMLPDGEDVLWLVYNDRIQGFNIREGKTLSLNHQPEQGFMGRLEPSAIAQAIAWNDSTLIVVGRSIHWFDKNKRVFSPAMLSEHVSTLGIKSAVRDGTSLWLIGFNGIACWSPETGKIVKYDIEDGVPVQYHEIEHAAIRLSDGRILAAWGNAGLVVFHPDSLRLGDGTPPKVRITGLSVMGQPQPFNAYAAMTSPFRLKHNQNILTVSYDCLSWQQRHHVAFRYRIQGNSGQWIENGSQRSISLAGLSPGSYVLEIEVRNREGQTAAENTFFPLRIFPPWYLSWPALLGYVLLLGVLGYQFYSLQLKRRMEASHARQLKEMDAFKTKFYTNITHEFRTPLTVILGMAQEAQDNPAQYFNKGLGLIRHNGLRLLELVNQVLEFSKLESGKLETRLQRGDGMLFLRYLTESYISFAETREVELSFSSGTASLPMDFDPEKVQQVLVNLLSNAIKFTRPGGWVQVSVELFRWEDPRLPGSLRMPSFSEGVLVIRVKDTGIGIAEADIRHIFDRYYQAKNKHSQTGTGIGLSLALELARWMGGDIQAESEQGKGSTFTFYLPVIHKPGTEAAIEWTFWPSGKAPASPEADREEAVAGADTPRLLLVEDNPDVLVYLDICLRSSYRLQTAANGREGLALARQMLPDLVISDVMMPELDGISLCAALKEDVRTSHIPVILLSARAGVSQKIEGLDRGADVYLIKPFDRAELLAQVRQLLEQRRRLQEYYRQTLGMGAPEVRERPVAPMPPLEEQFLKELYAVVSTHLTDPNFGASDLERALGMSHAQLFRKMKALLGYSANTLIRKMRIQKAMELLGDQTRSMAEVAFASGFNDPAYFSRVFKEETGIPPSEWIKER